MKYLLLLLPIVTLAQVPVAPTRLSVVPADAAITYPVGSVIPVPVVSSGGQFTASWYSPPSVIRTNASIYAQTNATIWIPEISIDGVTWTAFTEQLVYLPPTRAERASLYQQNQPCLNCLHVIVVYSATDQVRIHLFSY